jgi:alanine racemase
MVLFWAIMKTHMGKTQKRKKNIMESYLRCFANIDLNAIVHNIEEVKKKINKDTKVLAVVKANAYGHGADRVSECLKDKVDYFGVATIDEGVLLRHQGIKLPILVLGYTSPLQYKYGIEHDITLTIYSLEDGIRLNEIAGTLGKKAKFHIAVDTGMTRIGFPTDSRIEKSISDVKALSKLDCAMLEGAFTHFSCADMEDKTYFYKQKEKLINFFHTCKEAGIEIQIKHAANSASIMEFDDMCFNMVRSGIVTYGLYPSEEVNKSALDLIPAMEFKTHVVNINTVPAGVGISYGATYTTSSERIIATLSVGYADGYKRSLSNIGRVLIHGQYAPIVGRVCMDQMMVDITDIKGVKIEDEAILFGRDGDNFIPVEEVADLSGSFNYEFVCSVSERVKRIYS